MYMHYPTVAGWGQDPTNIPDWYTGPWLSSLFIRLSSTRVVIQIRVPFWYLQRGIYLYRGIYGEGFRVVPKIRVLMLIQNYSLP